MTSFAIFGRNLRRVVDSCLLLESFRFEDEDENDDQVLLLPIVRMLKSVTVMAWQCCCNQLSSSRPSWRRKSLKISLWRKQSVSSSSSSSSSSSNLKLPTRPGRRNLIATTLSRHHCHGFEHAHNEQKEDLVVVLVFVLVWERGRRRSTLFSPQRNLQTFSSSTKPGRRSWLQQHCHAITVTDLNMRTMSKRRTWSSFSSSSSSSNLKLSS